MLGYLACWLEKSGVCTLMIGVVGLGAGMAAYSFCWKYWLINVLFLAK